ncbi:hypothetical protein GOV12_05295, partial [Candidatus Pacearchaeota archaeon]|nr:hypothetical protein [Candidatus Pacearchaeota archaeon]
TLLLPSGCRQFPKQTNYPHDINHLIEDNPITQSIQSNLEIVNDPEVIEFYKTYFKDLKPELSYKFQTRKTNSRLFVRPKIKFDEKLEYEVFTGIEIFH